MNPSASTREKLKSFKIFSNISENDKMLDAVTEILHTVSFKPGENILKEGEIGSCVYLLVSGKVEICKSIMDKSNYTVANLIAEDSMLFGELALVGGDKRTATVKATSNCECWKLSREDFTKLGNQYPELGWGMLQSIASILASRLQKANEDVITLFEALVCEIGDDEKEKEK